MEAVAVYSDADAGSMHVRQADLAVRLGPPPPTESYLRIDLVVEAALATGADAIHPGYGFLSERAAFARAVEDAGLVFVGPPSAVIEALGDKVRARGIARSVGVEGVPGTLDPVAVDRPDQVAAIVAEADRIGYPLLVKAAAGGGGRGMRRVARAADLPAALAAGSAEAASAFGDGSVFLEREIRPARHIEVQLLGDATGAVVAIGERDCSSQRRHQKLIEEAPAPGLSTAERRHLHDLAVRVATAGGLQNAATAEFLRDDAGAFHFLEVNTRLQVEHGVTELVTGLDIVHEQFRLAAGEPLSAGRARRCCPRRRAGRPRHRGPAGGRGPGPRLRARAGPHRPLGHAGRPRGPGRHRPAGRGPGPARLRQPGREGHGPRRGPGRRHRPPATGARRDRDRRHPDDPALRPVRGHDTPGSGRATCRSSGSRSPGTGRRIGRAMPGRRPRLRPGRSSSGGSMGPRPTVPRRRAAPRPLRPRPPGRSPPAPTRPIGGRRDPPPRHGPGDRRGPRRRRHLGGGATGPSPDPSIGRSSSRHRARRRPVAGRRSRSSWTAGGSSSRSRTPVWPTSGTGPRRAARRRSHHGPTEVRAIIPGRVVSVAVEAGDAVVAGQRLLAVEAMKMENELRSPRAGTVDRVATAVGQTVELGDPLVVIR